MTATDLIANLTSRGIQFAAAGDRLRYYPADLLIPADLDQLRQHKEAILRRLRSEGGDPAPIVPGHVHWNPYISEADLAAGRWGEEFIVGYHIDPRQPSRLRGLCSGRMDTKPTRDASTADQEP